MEEKKEETKELMNKYRRKKNTIHAIIFDKARRTESGQSVNILRARGWLVILRQSLRYS
jgi:hypothetical protein